LNWQYVGVSRKNGNVILFANGQKEAEGAFSGNLEQTSWGIQQQALNVVKSGHFY